MVRETETDQQVITVEASPAESVASSEEEREKEIGRETETNRP